MQQVSNNLMMEFIAMMHHKTKNRLNQLTQTALECFRFK